MKKLTIILLLALILYGCNKDDNPVSGNNTVNNWTLIFSKADSITYTDTSYMQKIAYVKGTTNNKFWIKYSYKADDDFEINLKIRSGSYIYQNKEFIFSVNNWLNKSDSMNYTYPIEDTLYYNVIPSHTHYVSLKNLEVYLK